MQPSSEHRNEPAAAWDIRDPELTSQGAPSSLDKASECRPAAAGQRAVVVDFPELTR